MHTFGLVLHDLLAIALAHHASDLHLASNAPPKMRVQGLLQTMTCPEPMPTTVCAEVGLMCKRPCIALLATKPCTRCCNPK